MHLLSISLRVCAGRSALSGTCLIGEVFDPSSCSLKERKLRDPLVSNIGDIIRSDTI